MSTRTKTTLSTVWRTNNQTSYWTY